MKYVGVQQKAEPVAITAGCHRFDCGRNGADVTLDSALQHAIDRGDDRWMQSAIEKADCDWMVTCLSA